MFTQKLKCLFTTALSAIALAACSSNSFSQASHDHWTLRDYIFPSVRNNTWAMMSERFKFKSQYTQPEVQRQVKWFKKNRSYFTQLTKNAKPYLYYVYQQTLNKRIPPEVALLPMIESNYNPFLFSHSGATGLWQMMPGTASGSGLSINWWYDGRRDIVTSTQAALNYLVYLHGFFHDWLLAIAAYNAGAGTVQQAVRHNKALGKPTDYWHLALPAETKNYVPKLLAIAAIIQAPQHKGIRIAAVKYRPFFKSITLKGEYNLPLLAKMANVSMKDLRLLNPGFRRNTTAPHLSYQLLLPINSSQLFQHNLNTIKKASATWTHYRVRHGDNLIRLARQYHTNAFIIKQVNHLRSNRLHINQTLLIPSTQNRHVYFKSQNASIAEDNLPGPSKVIHTVRPKDSIWSIAKQYHVKPTDVMYWNNLSHYRLKPGKKLIIWEQHFHDSTSYFIHTVKKGDSLIRLAKRFSTNRRLIRLYNGMHHNTLRIGQKLKIPRHHKRYYRPRFHNQLVIHYVKPGDSISSLAEYYRTTKSQVCHWNHLKKNQLLKLGQTIKIYFSS